MIKCFLSHSSNDKKEYINKVADLIKREHRIIDEESFESGMITHDEIIRFLNQTNLFVLFISDSSLESTWVMDELNIAYNLLNASQLNRIYPIIIDRKINHKDPRIPDWMKNKYNIQHIESANIATRKINARLIELSWSFHPKLKERQKIFVGRNDIVKTLEERIDNFNEGSPIAIFSSGLPSIGRKSVLIHALKKANLISEAYEFPIISLDNFDSIEEVVLKIDDLGFTNLSISRDVFLNSSVETKKQILLELLKQLIKLNEKVLIEDRGVLVQSTGEIVDWFIDILKFLKIENDYILFGIASQYRINQKFHRKDSDIFFSINIKELEPSERQGLFKRYSCFHEITISKENFSFFSDLLTGYPEQVLYLVDMIKDRGIIETKKDSHFIQQYSSEKAKIVLDNLQKDDDGESIKLINLLSRFEFISYELLFEIVDENIYSKILEKLLVSSICERLGGTQEYIRLNGAIRDYVQRNRFGIESTFDNAIKQHVAKFVQDFSKNQTIENDLSDYIFSVQESLLKGNSIDDRWVSPSVFIRTIKKLYDDDRNYNDALILIERVLEKQNYLHENTLQHILFIKCQCLARLHKQEFYHVVSTITNTSKQAFLYGFNYRLSGNYASAEKQLRKAFDSYGRNDPRIVSELVLVYMQSDEHESAYLLAKENFERGARNLLNANSYFACLIRREKTPDNRMELEKIMLSLSIDSSERAKEMYVSAKARILAYYDNNQYESMQCIDEAISTFPNIAYPLLTKAELATHFYDKIKLREAIEALEGKTSRGAQTFRTFVRYKALLLAMEGNPTAAKKLVETDLRGLISTSKERLIEKIDNIYSMKIQ